MTIYRHSLGMHQVFSSEGWLYQIIREKRYMAVERKKGECGYNWATWKLQLVFWKLKLIEQCSNQEHMCGKEAPAPLSPVSCISHLVFPQADNNNILWILWSLKKKGKVYIFKPPVKKKFFNKGEHRFRAMLNVSKISTMGHSTFSTYQAM